MTFKLSFSIAVYYGLFSCTCDGNLLENYVINGYTSASWFTPSRVLRNLILRWNTERGYVRIALSALPLLCGSPSGSPLSSRVWIS